MSRRNYFLPVFSFLFFTSVQAGNLSAPKEKPYWFGNAFTQGTYFFYPAMPGQLEIGFPYSIHEQNSGALIRNGYFLASKNSLPGNGKFSYTFPGFEIGRGRFSLEASMNFITGPVWGWTDNEYFGLNYRLPAPGFLKQTESIRLGAFSFPGPRFVSAISGYEIKIRLGILYYHPLFKLGEIPMEARQNFYALGALLPEENDTTFNQRINVYFQQNMIALAPAVSVGRNFENGFHLSLLISPLIMLEQKGGIRFYYRSGSQSDTAPGGYNLHYIHLRTDPLVAKFNGETIHNTPFRFSGFTVTLRIGLHMSAY